MRYLGMPLGMWLLFRRSFKKNLETVLCCDAVESQAVTKKALKKYKEIVHSLPEFEKEDRFRMNILSCAMLSAFYLNLKEKPSVDKMTVFYRQAMMTRPMKWFCRQSGKRKFTEKDITAMRKTAKLKAADRNPYSWNMDLYIYEDGSGYGARFTKCGICTLMKELGIFEIVPAMCHLDYTMSEAGGASSFTRKYTLASGGPYCDCGYKRLYETGPYCSR